MTGRRLGRVTAAVGLVVCLPYSFGYALGFRSGLSLTRPVPTLRETALALGAIPPREVVAQLRAVWAGRA